MPVGIIVFLSIFVLPGLALAYFVIDRQPSASSMQDEITQLSQESASVHLDSLLKIKDIKEDEAIRQYSISQQIQALQQHINAEQVKEAQR